MTTIYQFAQWARSISIIFVCAHSVTIIFVCARSVTIIFVLVVLSLTFR